jgi:Ca-activated chloride channel homolog
MKPIKLFVSTLLALSLLAVTLVAQSGRKTNDPKSSTKTGQPSENTGSVEGISESRTAPGGETIEGDVLKFNTSLVTVPVTVLDRYGRYVPQLQRNDFHIFENGVEQKIAYFATTTTPFTVVLVIDTSGSTQLRLDDIQNAAINFVGKLKPDDSVMVMSFDDRIDVHTKPTTDRTVINRAIRRTSTGGGTRLYDAVDAILRQQLKTITGRKAVVLFTDGVDTTSRRASYDSTVRMAEESDAPIYAVDYGTSAKGVFGQRRPTIFGLPLPQPGVPGTVNTSPSDSRRAIAYLNALSNNTGGRVYSGDSMFGIAQAFTWIAEELGRQYSLGYYPQTAGGTGQRRQIKVKVDEPNAVVKARDSYIYSDKRSADSTEKDKQSEKQPFGSDSRNYLVSKSLLRRD